MIEMQGTEHAIEEMTQEGYLIYKVLVFYPHNCLGGKWVPLEETETLPDSATIWLFGKRADGNIKSFMIACDNMEWLSEWWKGRWQANI